jgi:predicted membrane chloride channel (bestrophin family)
MAEDTTGGIGQADDIQKQITQALEEIEQIRNTRQVITNPDGLEAAERAILQATDKLAALMTALKIQQAVDSDELSERADELVQAMPEKLKNQGRRLVSIRSSRGAAVEVAAPYYSRKKKKDKRRKGKKK